ncbi:hypothetical protein B1207_14260 [Legionella quinlivanii]|uniref:Integrase n=1 Tax=Legionella quinlivanii TaxID=45073 RepID=A0A364LG13_9GAMM|nr:hypothetical protein B1207_14260 [Legionella quinlivanii]
MIWQSSEAETEKLKFIGDWLKNEFDFTDLCTRYGVSRKTGYKLRYKPKYIGTAIKPDTTVYTP